jgi:hypothetical protein
MVIADVREATRALLVATLGREPAGGTDLTRQLDLDTTLAWRVCRLIQERDDPFAAARFVPGDMAMRRVLRAAQDAGASAQTCQAYERAAEAFGGFVSERAGSRKTFDVLASGFRDATGERHERELRRSGFHASSFVQGIQAGLEVAITAMWPSRSHDRTFDIAVINGVAGLRQLRPGARWRMGRAYRGGKSKELLQGDVVCEAIESGGELRDGPHAMPVLRELSTDPLPRCSVRTLENGAVVYDLEPNDLGKREETDCLIGVLLREVGYRFKDESLMGIDAANLELLSTFRTSVRPRVPSERFVTVFAVHRSLFLESKPDAAIFNSQFTGDSAAFENWDRVPIRVDVRPAGNSVKNALADSVLPALPDAVRLAIDSSGLPVEDFEIYRADIEFIPLLTAMRFEWPRGEAPTERPNNP